MADCLVNMMVADKNLVEALELLGVYFAKIVGQVLSTGDEVVQQQDLSLAVGGLGSELADESRNLRRRALPGDSADSDRSEVDFRRAQHVCETQVSNTASSPPSRPRPYSWLPGMAIRGILARLSSVRGSAMSRRSSANVSTLRRVAAESKTSPNKQMASAPRSRQTFIALQNAAEKSARRLRE